MNTKVSCTVNTCTYWAKGNECSADGILVQSDQGQSSTQQFSASNNMASTSALNMSSTPAHESKETQCRTFKQK